VVKAVAVENKSVVVDFNKAKELYLRCFNSFEDFSREFLSEYLTSTIPQFHKDLYELIPKSERLCLATPRGHGKSTIVSVSTHCGSHCSIKEKTLRLSPLLSPCRLNG
jgi:hypothetical protein